MTPAIFLGAILLMIAAMSLAAPPGTTLVRGFGDQVFHDRFEGSPCGVSNWSLATGLSDTDAGFQGADNRRYGGPCGLRIPVDGTARYVMDDSPMAEASYIARFYAFLDNAGSAPIIIFTADDGTDDQIQVWYNAPSAGDLTLTVFDQAAADHNLTFSNIGFGWHSVEVVWEAAAAADIRFALNSDDPNDDLSMSVDTSSLVIAGASLGNVDGAKTGGTMDFDDFDSRRISRVERLLRGDANDDEVINIADIIAIADEIDGLEFASGQPDCNEDGEIDVADVTCMVDLLDNQPGGAR